MAAGATPVNALASEVNRNSDFFHVWLVFAKLQNLQYVGLCVK